MKRSRYMLKQRLLRRASLGAELLEDRIALAFTAYNGMFSSPATHANITLYADVAGSTAAGPLKDVSTGQNVTATVVTNQVGAVFDARGVNPASGTDAATIFAGFVDFATGDLRSIEIDPSASYEYTFEDLDPGATYQFAGTAIRGNNTYTDRWTLVRLEGATSFTAAHSTGLGVVTSGLPTNQVAFWAGDNSASGQGYVAQWRDIDPGEDGVFQIISTQYQGAIPTSIHAGGQATGSKSYAVSAFRLIENAPNGPPAVENSSPSSIEAFAARATGRVVTTGGQIPEVRLYYGSQDGGPNPAAWQHVVELGRQSNTFSALLGSLTQNTTYYYRAFAQNQLGGAWSANTTSFTTLTASPPSIVADPASNVGAFSASLNGRITDTGNDPPLVTLYYGNNDGGVNANSWDHSVLLDVQQGSFTAAVADLQPLTQYYFAFLAQNQLGSQWTSPARTFTTSNTPPLVISEFMADNANVLTTRTRTSSATPFAGDFLSPDWIELHNPTNTDADLGGFYLTDDLTDLQKWQFPAGTLLPANGYLVVFASARDIRIRSLDERGNLHTNFELDSVAGESLALVDGNGVIVWDYTDLPIQLENVSYGLDAIQEERYFRQPTAGVNNANDVPNSPTFSVKSRTFTNSLVVELQASLPTETIRYTLDETTPTATSPIYSGPLTLNATTQIRAMSVGANGKSSLVTSETYVRLGNDILNENSNLPIIVVETFGDGISGSATFSDTFVGVVEPGATARTRLTDSFTTTTRAGMHARGSSSLGFSKKQYRVEFWNESNEDAQQELLGMPGEADWIFYGPGVFDRALVNNPLMYELSNQLGRYAVRTRWAEMYINANGGDLTRSDYVGLYAIMEVVEEGDDRVDVGELSTGAGGIPVSGGFIRKVDRGSPYVDPDSPNTAQQTYIESWFNGLTTTAASPNRGDPQLGYARYIDVESFLDHHILNLLSFNVDALRLSTYYHKTPDGKLAAGPIWDFDRALESTDGRDDNPQRWFDSGGTDFFGHSGDGGWWTNLFDDPGFVRQYIDRWYELRSGVLSLDNINATIDRHAAQISEAAARDYGRWSGSRFGNFAGEIQHMKDYIRTRIQWIESQWLGGPRFNVTGPQVNAGTQVTLTSPTTGGRIFYTLDGTDPSGLRSQQVELDLLRAGSSTRIHVPSAPNLIEACRAVGVVIAVPQNCFMNPRYVEGTLGETWGAGSLPAGFDQGVPSQYGGVLRTDIGAQARGVNSSVYLRIPFDVTAAQRSAMTTAKLNVRYDDGFAAYLWFDSLNVPVQIARRNAPGTSSAVPITPLAYNASATAVHNNGVALVTESIDIPVSYFLSNRTNYLIVQLMNADINSDDLLFDVSITYPTTSTELPPNVIEYTTPITINQFTEITARVYRENHGPTTQGYVAAGDDWSAPISRSYFIDPPASRTNIAIAEVHYNPTPPTTTEVNAGFTDNDEFEFIELLNTSNQPLELSGAKFVEIATERGTEGIEFDFANADVTRIAPGERLVVVENLAAFRARYGVGIPVAGTWTGRLDNTGETLTLIDLRGQIIQQLSYADRGDWPGRADGRGSSLEAIVGQSDYRLPSAWQSSIDFDGSPGRNRRQSITPIIVNELLANSQDPEQDAIELYNRTDAPIDIGGWYLSDDADELFQRFRIPNGTMIPAHGYISFNEDDFNSGRGANATDFSLSSFGDDLWLIGADATSYYFADQVDFGTTQLGVSLGRLPDGGVESDWFPLANTTIGQANTGHRIGDLIISEVHYNPAGPDAGFEFVELFNRTNVDIDLSLWRLNRGVDFDFPIVILPAGNTIVVVDFDPLTDAIAAEAFRARYGVGDGVHLIGPWQVSDVLDDGGERIVLERQHDELEPGESTYEFVLVDQVRYDDVLPWDPSADGSGASLQRTTAESFGNEPTAWISTTPNPGSVDFGRRGDFDGDDDVDAADIDLLFAELARSERSPRFDLSGDSLVDRRDVDTLVRSILGTEYGDANLDGRVDADDFSLWEEQRFTEGGGWALGDWNGDRQHDASDFNLWNQYKFTEASSASGRSHLRRTPHSAAPTASSKLQAGSTPYEQIAQKPNKKGREWSIQARRK